VIPTIRVLVTDLDNTLYDWVTFFSAALDQMLIQASQILDISPEQVATELQQVHRGYRNTEQPFALLEIETVRTRYPHATRRETARLLDPAFHAFNRSRNENLRLYDGVRATLQQVYATETLVIGHTDATSHNALFRLKKLGILDFFSAVWSSTPAGPGHPDEIKQEELDGQQFTVLHEASFKKPDPKALSAILDRIDARPSEVLYVGDSLVSDISMARALGVWSAWAEYGTHFGQDDWAKIVTVTHWTAEDVQRAREARARVGEVKPDVVLNRSFADVLAHFQFGPYRGAFLDRARANARHVSLLSR